jgi:hypothetical protein
VSKTDPSDVVASIPGVGGSSVTVVGPEGTRAGVSVP